MNLPFLSELSAVFGYVSHASMLGAAAVVLVLVIRWSFGGRLAPAARSWLWLPAALLCLSPQLHGVVSCGWSWNVSPPVLPQPVNEVEIPAREVPTVVRGEPRLLLDSPGPVQAAPGARLTPWEKAAVGWAVGSGTLFSFWLVVYAGLWRRIRQNPGPVSESLAAEFQACARICGFRSAPRLMVSTAVDGPAVAGIWHPVVLMPPQLAESLGAEALRHVLLHELAHLKRRDLWLHWASALVVALHWFNPLVWLASRKFRGDREAACDAMVIRLGGNQAHAYGQTLLALESHVSPPIALRLMAGILGGRDLVRQRIVDITHLGKTSWRAAWIAFLAILSGVAVLALAAAEPAAPNVAPPTTKETSNATLPNGLYTRTFKVTPDFLNWTQTLQERESQTSGNDKVARKTALEVLKNLGVDFPEGASATFVPATSQLIVRNTPANLDFIGSMVDARLSHPARQVYVHSHLVVFKEGEFPSLWGAPEPTAPSEKPAAPKDQTGPLLVQHSAPLSIFGVFTDSQFQALLASLTGKASAAPPKELDPGITLASKDLSPKVEAIIALPAVTTRSRNKVTVEVIREFIYPTEYDRKEPAKQGGAAQDVPKNFQMRPVGLTLEIEPVIGPDGYTIDLNLCPKFPALTGWVDSPAADGGKIKNPIFNSNAVHTAVTISDGQTVALGGHSYVPAFLMNPSLQGEPALISKKYPVMIFVTARMIDPRGHRVKGEALPAEKPDASEKAPPAPLKDAKIPTPNGLSVSRALIDVGPGSVYSARQLTEKSVAVFVQTQIELLQSTDIYKRAEERTETYHPYVAPVPVTLEATRVPGTTQVEVTASGASADYVLFFLKRLLEVLIAHRKELKDRSTLGAALSVLKSVLEKSEEVEALEAEHKEAIRKKVPREKAEKLKADLDHRQEELRVWTQKFEQMDVSSTLRDTRFFELQILEPPSSTQAP